MQLEISRERHKRWKGGVAALWRDLPGVVYNWLRGSSAPWGMTPILAETGMQCLSVEAVDIAVRGYWVDTVLRQHAPLNGDAQWTTFMASPFAAHIPVLQWPTSIWSTARVRAVLQQMREAASPGMLGIPIAVWRCLPEEWMAAVAKLLSKVEASGTWPSEWLDAYVAMIPKAAGGARPRDQRPITLLEVMYRVWSKGITMEWRPVLQNPFLGQQRWGSGRKRGRCTLHSCLPT